ncbi:Dolichyl-phosphate-mannose--protein mannosyltransferase 4, partial [Kickxella alabastrina]
MIFFMLAAVYAYIKFFKLRYKPFGAQWWTWLLATGAMLGCVVSCKLVGLFTITLIGSAVIYDLWRIIDIRRGTTMTQFAHHFIARAVALIAVPFAVYLAFFYVHFAVLTNTGTGDVYHTPKFQMQLRDNFMTKSSFDVHYGDRITFKHRETNVYLESSEARYPLRYEDKRISSQGQQVTGAKKLSDNGFWTIKPARDYAEFTEFLQRRRAGEETSEELERWRVMNTDIVHLQHVTTGTYLRTHDVASPMTPTNMEFTTVLLNSTLEENAPEIYEDTLWELMIDGTSDNSTQLRTSSSFVRLVSKKHGVSMWTHKKALPEWGHGNQEINGNKKPNEKSNLWTVTQIHGRKTSDEEKAEMVKRVEPMGFLAKFAELQGLMIKHNNALTTVHPFQSTPLSWPFLTRGISFWTNAAERKQIYLLGNPVGWWLSDIALVVYAVVMVALELANRRNEEIVDG